MMLNLLHRLCLIGVSSTFLLPITTSLYGESQLNSADENSYDINDLTQEKHSDGKRGPRGPRGYRGHDGKQGPRGERGRDGILGSVGPTGPTGASGEIGPTGATGPTGSAGPVVVGLAQSFTPDTAFGGQTVNAGFGGGIFTTVDLHASSTSNITFDPENSSFTILNDGNYLISYGLSGSADADLVTDWSAGTVTAWIAVERHTGGSPGVTSELGAVPLSLTQSLAQGGTPGSGPEMVSGYGQLSASLVAGDTIKLMLFISNGDGGPATLSTGMGLIMRNSQKLSQGGTLSLLLIPQS